MNINADGLVLTYRRAGGLVTGDQLAAMLGDQVDQPLSQVARWIVHREVVSFCAGRQIMVPLFQFDPDRWVIRPVVRLAVVALRDRMDDLALAAWFLTPAPGRDGRSRLEVMCASEPVAGDEARRHPLNGCAVSARRAGPPVSGVRRAG